MTHVYLVHRDDPADPEVDVVTDFDLAVRLAKAIGGHYEEQPVLALDDEYVQLLLHPEEVG